ncbi:MAG: TonB-dependent receptor [Prevotellaceae bacterium]|nr:TonB-dependent receptor [Prevotellaceae bacterium]
MSGHYRLRIVALTLMLVFTAIGTFAQQKVTIDVKNATLKQVFSVIEKQTTYRFSYKTNIIDNRSDITLKKEAAAVATVLDEALKGRPLEYSIVSAKSIVISSKQTKQNKAQGAKQTVRGTVKDDMGEPVMGATVSVVGSDGLAVTDIDGKFTIEAPKGSTLKISYLGFVDREVKADDNVKVLMKEDTQALDELVVVGYGTMKRSDMTGALSSVDTKELSKRTTTNAAEALQGKVAGVNITKSGGNAGAGVSVKIRGVKTFGDNEPLYIIDGFPGDINSLNPQDIESMEILKDGAAAAIYGSVAANGVIIITTKNGKKGDVKVDFSTYLSFTTVAKDLDMLDAEGYKSVHKAMYENYNAQYGKYPNGNLPAYVTKNTGVNTDWQDVTQRNGLSQSYMISVRGGADKAQYSVSYNHADEKGIFIGNDHRHDIARMKLHATKGIIDLDANMDFKYTNSQQPQYSLKETYMISPLVPVYDDNEKYGFGLTNFDGLPNNRNVMADAYYKSSVTRKYHTTANVALTFNFTPWLNFKTSYAYRGEHEVDTYHAPDYIADPKSPSNYPYNSETRAYWEEQLWENVLSFNKQFGKHGVNAMFGTSMTSRKYNWSSVAVEGKTIVYKVEDGQLVQSEKAAGFLDPNFTTIGAGAGGTFSGSGSKWVYNRASFFGRVNYNFNDRYLFQFTFREDGSSKFGSDSRWGFFPSVAVGWRISEEPFYPKGGVVSNLKFRASWGQLGNENALGYYDFLALISTYNDLFQGYVQGSGSSAWSGSIARALENRSLKWETTDTKNIGFDFGLFNNRLNGNINYYINETRDLLITRSLAPSAGLSNPVLNVGKMRNQGVELELNWNDNISDFNYTVGFNLSTVKNKVVELANAEQTIYGEGLKYGSEHFPTQTKVGKPIGSFYLYQADGIFQTKDEINRHVNSKGELLQPDAQPGDIRFIDTNGDGYIDEDDKVYCGSGIPKVEANINLSANWRGFDFSAVISGSFGFKIYNANRYLYEGMNSASNFLATTLNAWTPTNTSTDIPRAIYGDPNDNTRESTRFLENGDFVRLRQAQLGYTLPASLSKAIYCERIRFYVSGENLFTITGYSGANPEFSRSSVLNTGIDKLIYPFTRSYTVGAQVTF